MTDEKSQCPKVPALGEFCEQQRHLLAKGRIAHDLGCKLSLSLTVRG